MAVKSRIDAIIMADSEFRELAEAADNITEAISKDKWDDIEGTTGFLIVYRVEREINNFLKVWKSYTGQEFRRYMEEEHPKKKEVKNG